MKLYTINKELAGNRIDKVLPTLDENLTRVMAQKLIEQENVKVNGKSVKTSYKLNENDLFIARYILEHSEEIPLLSSHQLAKETFTSPTAIIRFVKKLGFESYNDFKLNIHSFLNQYYLSNMHIQSHENLYSVKNKLTEIDVVLFIKQKIILTLPHLTT